MPLTKMDIIALRKADRLHFFRNDEESAIRCIKEVNGDPYEKERVHVVKVASRLCDYGTTHTEGGEPKLPDPERYNGHAMIYGSDGCFSTAAWIIREGDEIVLEWVRCNNSGTLDKHRLSQDELRLCVDRTKKRGYFKFHLTDTICERDSSARIVRPA